MSNETTPILLKSNLKQLKLATMLCEWEKLAREAAANNEAYESYLLRLTEAEVTTRSANALAARIRGPRNTSSHVQVRLLLHDRGCGYWWRAVCVAGHEADWRGPRLSSLGHHPSYWSRTAREMDVVWSGHDDAGILFAAGDFVY